MRTLYIKDYKPCNTDGKRACLCPDGKTYSRKCCDGSFQAQGIGSVSGTS